MRRTAWYRLPEHIQFCFLIAGMLAVLIAIFPNYEALSYSKTEAVNDTNNYLGYPPGDEVAVLSTAEEIEQETHVFTMEVEADQIKPLGVYHGLGVYRNVSKFGAFRFMNRFETEKVYGQFYSVELENGDQVIILLDDLVVKLPRTGKVKLPRGKLEKLGETSKDYLSEKMGKPRADFKYYVDAASSWRSFEGKKSIQLRTLLLGVCFVLGLPLAYLFLSILSAKNKNGETQEASSGSASNTTPKEIQGGSDLEQSKEEQNKSRLQEKIEANMDKFSQAHYPGYDWRKDRKRSWSRLGAHLKLFGLMLVCLFVWIAFFLNKEMNVVFFVVICIGCIIFVLGVIVGRWGKPKK